MHAMMNKSASGSMAPGRAGEYRPHPAGYRAFHPRPLPPSPPLALTPALLRRLSRADRGVAGLDSAILTLPDPQRFLAMYVRKEAVLSSQIEGTQSSLDDLLRSEAKVPGSPIPGDVGEVSNYVRAMQHGMAQLPELPVSSRLIRDLHERLLRGTRGADKRPGDFRQGPVWIGAEGASLSEAVFVPPPPDAIADAIQALEHYIHTTSEEDVPLLIQIGLIHAQFETIHPFADGNGRIGRLLITLLLCEKGLLRQPVLHLSTFFKLYRQSYYERLQAIRDAGDWEGWISFFLDGVAEIAEEASALARRIVALREEHWRLIADRLGARASNGFRLIEHMYRSPYITVNQATEILSVSFPNANALLQDLVESGLLREVTGQQRNRIFFYAPYVALFTAR